MRSVVFFKSGESRGGAAPPPRGGLGGAELPPISFQMIRKKNPFSPP